MPTDMRSSAGGLKKEDRAPDPLTPPEDGDVV